jgi:hypothetical protein
MRFFVMSDLGHSLEDNRAEEHTEVSADNVHESDHSRVLTVVDNYVGILEDEERLRKNEYDRGHLSHNANHKCYGAVLDCGPVVEKGLDHLNETEAAVDHGAHGEYGRAHAHIQLTCAVLFF